MTPRYTVWVTNLAQRDWSALNLAAIALVVVVIYESVNLWPEPWRIPVRRGLVMLGGLIYVALFVVEMAAFLGLPGRLG